MKDALLFDKKTNTVPNSLPSKRKAHSVATDLESFEKAKTPTWIPDDTGKKQEAKCFDLNSADSETARAIATLREFSKQYDAGVRVVSETLSPQEDNNHTGSNSTEDGKSTIMKQGQPRSRADLHAAELEKAYALKSFQKTVPRVPNENRLSHRMETIYHATDHSQFPDIKPSIIPTAQTDFGQTNFHQAAQMTSLPSNMTSNQWNPTDVNPVAYSAYMKSMHQQVIHHNQAILGHTQFLNENIAQQQRLSYVPQSVGTSASYSVNGKRRKVYDGNSPSHALKGKDGIEQDTAAVPKPVKNKRGRPKRNPAEGWPKRPLSAYNIFFKEYREKIVGSDNESSDIDDDDTPDMLKPFNRRRRRKKHGKISFGQLAKSVGQMWKELSPETLAYYEKKAIKSREEYRKKIKAFLQKKNATVKSQTHLG